MASSIAYARRVTLAHRLCFKSKVKFILFIRGKGSNHYWPCLLLMVSVWQTNAGPGPYMLLGVVTSDGHIVAQQQNPAVTKELLLEIWSWKMERATDTEIICHL